MKNRICPQCGGNIKGDAYRRECPWCGNEFDVINSAAESKYNIPKMILKSTSRKTAAVITAATVTAVLLLAVYYFCGAGSSYPGDKPKPLQEFGSDVIEPEKKRSSEIIRLNPVPDSIGNLYFHFFVKNTGEVPLRPEAEIHLLDKTEKKIAGGHGYSIRSYILPGEETFVSVLVMKAPAYDSLKAVSGTEYPSYYPVRPEMKFSELKMERPKDKWDSYTITGRVTNADKIEGTYVQVLAVLIDDAGLPAGHGTDYIAQKKFPPGDDAPFRIEIRTVKGKIEKFILDYSALSEVRPDSAGK